MPDSTHRAGAACVITLVAMLATSCGGSGGGSSTAVVNWLIPENEVVDGGPGKDGIPAIDDPRFDVASAVQVFDPEGLVAVIRHENEIRAFPYEILNWHEVVNNGPTENPVSLSYCPLTGSSVAWAGDSGQTRRSFGVSGLLYNSNLILYDRKSDSYWSQMLQQAVAGSRSGERPATLQVVEMKLATLIDMFPDAQVMTRDTGWNHDYDVFSVGPDGDSKAPLPPKVSHDDIIRANGGGYIGEAWKF